MPKALGESQLKALSLAIRFGFVSVVDDSDYVLVCGFRGTSGDMDWSRLYRPDWEKLASLFEQVEDRGEARIYRLASGVPIAPDLSRLKTVATDVPEWNADQVWCYENPADGFCLIASCGGFWRLAWEQDQSLITAVFPKDCAYALVIRYRFTGPDDYKGTRTVEDQPWKPLRALARWLADLPTLRVEFEPASADDAQAFRSAWEKIATRVLATEGKTNG